MLYDEIPRNSDTHHWAQLTHQVLTRDEHRQCVIDRLPVGLQLRAPIRQHSGCQSVTVQSFTQRSTRIHCAILCHGADLKAAQRSDFVTRAYTFTLVPHHPSNVPKREVLPKINMSTEELESIVFLHMGLRLIERHQRHQSSHCCFWRQRFHRND